jgi:hypothetical protein
MDFELPDRTRTLFYIALLSIVLTGLVVGMGSDNFWALAYITPPLGRHTWASPKTVALLASILVLAALGDLVALGFAFAAGVVFVQRLRGRV